MTTDKQRKKLLENMHDFIEKKRTEIIAKQCGEALKELEERKRFEAWGLTVWDDFNPITERNLKDGGYHNIRIDTAWNAWQAARANSGWLPIESAPKGEEILVVDENGVIAIAIWDNEVDEWVETHAQAWLTVPPVTLQDEVFSLSKEARDDLLLLLDEPTHWMPLPQPPKQQGE